MSYSITAIEGIDADDAKALKSVGIRTTEKLLEAAKKSERTQVPRRQGRTRREEAPALGQYRRQAAHQGHGQGICWAVVRGRRRDREGTAIPQPRSPRQSHGRGQQKAKAGSLPSLGEARDALGRARQEAAPENHLSIGPSCGRCGRLTPLPGPAQSDGHDAGAPSCRF